MIGGGGGGGGGERSRGDGSGGEGGGARGVSLSPTPVSSLSTSSSDDIRSLFKWSCDLAVTGGDGSGHVSSSSSAAEEASEASPAVSMKRLVQQWSEAAVVLGASAASSAAAVGSITPCREPYGDVASIDSETKIGETNGHGGDEGGRGPVGTEKTLNLDLFRCPVRPSNTHTRVLDIRSVT